MRTAFAICFTYPLDEMNPAIFNSLQRLRVRRLKVQAPIQAVAWLETNLGKRNGFQFLGGFSNSNLTYLHSKNNTKRETATTESGHNTENNTLWVRPNHVIRSADEPPAKPPPTAPIRLLTFLFFTRSLELHTWQVIELWLVSKSTF